MIIYCSKRVQWPLTLIPHAKMIPKRPFQNIKWFHHDCRGIRAIKWVLTVPSPSSIKSFQNVIHPHDDFLEVHLPACSNEASHLQSKSTAPFWFIRSTDSGLNLAWTQYLIDWFTRSTDLGLHSAQNSLARGSLSLVQAWASSTMVVSAANCHCHLTSLPMNEISPGKKAHGAHGLRLGFSTAYQKKNWLQKT